MESGSTSADTVPHYKYADFRLLYLIMQMIGGLIIILMACWVFFYLGGLSWSSTPSVQFNWHPLLMTIGMIYLYGNCKHLPMTRAAINKSLTLTFLILFFTVSHTDLSWTSLRTETQLETNACIDIWIDFFSGDYCIMGGL